VRVTGVALGPWIPPFLWTGVILWLSGPAWSEEATGGWLLPLLRTLLPWVTPGQVELLHWMLRKGAHLVEYALLAWLWHRAWDRAGHGRRPVAAFALAVAAAVADETHQAWGGARGGSALDVLLDAAGAGTGVLLRHRGWRRAPDGAPRW
jgi:VanZ family protein